MEKILNNEKFSDFCSIHGVNHIFNSNHHKIVRLFWIFAVLLSFCGFFFYLKNGWFKLMYEPEVLIKTREKSADDFPFPAITVCPRVIARSEVFKYSDIDFREQNRSILTVDECKIAISNLLPLDENKVLDLLENNCAKENLLDFSIAETILSNSIDTKKFFFPANKFSQRTGLSGFGACYTSNGLSFRQLFNTKTIDKEFMQFQKFLSNGLEDNSTWSPEKGLQINNRSELRLLSFSPFRFSLTLSPKDAKNLADGPFFHLFVHKPNEVVSKLNKDFVMNYNESRRFRLKSRSRKTDDALRQFTPESRKCYFENEKPLKFFKSYTKLNCESECRANDNLRDCGCVLYSMPRDNRMKVCNIEEMNCKPKPSKCDCYAPCNDLTFELTSETLQVDKNQNEGISDWDGDFLTEDFVEETEYYSAYKTQNFIAEFGGFLGLFMGCSLLSIVEVLFYVLLTIRSSLHKVCQKASSDSTSSVIQVISMEPLNSNHQMLETLNELRRSVEGLRNKISENQNKIDENYAKIETNFAKVESNLFKVDTRFLRIEKKVKDNLIFENF